MMFNNEIITQDSIIKAREFFTNLSKELIVDVKSGKLFVNNPENYIKSLELRINEYNDGKLDNTFTFAQRAYYFQTGKLISLLK